MKRAATRAAPDDAELLSLVEAETDERVEIFVRDSEQLYKEVHY